MILLEYLNGYGIGFGMPTVNPPFVTRSGLNGYWDGMDRHYGPPPLPR